MSPRQRVGRGGCGLSHGGGAPVQLGAPPSNPVHLGYGGLQPARALIVLRLVDSVRSVAFPTRCSSGLLHRTACRTPPCCTPGSIRAGAACWMTDGLDFRRGALQRVGPLQRVGVRLVVPCDSLVAVSNTSAHKKLRSLDLNRGPLHPTLLSRPLH